MAEDRTFFLCPQGEIPFGKRDTQTAQETDAKKRDGTSREKINNHKQKEGKDFSDRLWTPSDVPGCLRTCTDCSSTDALSVNVLFSISAKAVFGKHAIRCGILTAALIL